MTIFAAIYSKDTESIKELMSTTPANIRDHNQCTPFLRAVFTGNLEAIKLFASNNFFNVSDTDEYGHDAIILAAMSNTIKDTSKRKEILNYLIDELGFEITKDNFDKLKASVFDNKTEMVDFIQEKLDKQLITYCQKYQKKLENKSPKIRKLLEAGANPNYKDHNEMTAPMWAIYQGRTIIFDLFYKEGLTDSNSKDKYGNNLLDLAFMSMKESAIDYLIAETNLVITEDFINKHRSKFIQISGDNYRDELKKAGLIETIIDNYRHKTPEEQKQIAKDFREKDKQKKLEQKQHKTDLEEIKIEINDTHGKDDEVITKSQLPDNPEKTNEESTTPTQFQLTDNLEIKKEDEEMGKKVFKKLMEFYHLQDKVSVAQQTSTEFDELKTNTPKTPTSDILQPQTSDLLACFALLVSATRWFSSKNKTQHTKKNTEKPRTTTKLKTNKSTTRIKEEETNVRPI